jgi:hypothetical protein
VLTRSLGVGGEELPIESFGLRRRRLHATALIRTRKRTRRRRRGQ